MGFGFNLVGFPILVLTTATLLIYFAFTKSRTALKILAVIWGFAIICFITVSLMQSWSRPIKLKREEIIGEYRIDRNFYPGTHADWQYKHYKFEITSSDSIFFYQIAGKKEQVFKAKIVYKPGPPELWSIEGDSLPHILKSQPTLYRGHDKFYYVFYSSHYKNMFFRKVKK